MYAGFSDYRYVLENALFVHAINYMCFELTVSYRLVYYGYIVHYLYVTG